MQERLVDRSYDTLVWYANNFWTWFLAKKKEKRGRYRVFVCHDLQGYPEDFFVAAHRSRQGKYFYHFGKALDASRERAELRKKAKEQAGQPSMDLSVPPTEVEQEFPEALHIADNETEEVEGDDLSERIAHTEPSAPREEPIPFATTPSAAGESSSSPSITVTPPSPITTRERILDMFDFSRKNREALEQLRLAVETLTRTLVQGRDQLRSEVTRELETVKHTLDTQARQISLFPSELSRLRADVVGQIQAVEQTLIKEQERLREGVTDKVEVLTEEIHKQARISPDLASIRMELQSSSEHLQQGLLKAIQQAYTLPELPQMATTLVDVQQQVGHLASLVKQVAQRPSVSPNRQIRAIQASIRDGAAKAQDALDTLEHECMAWLDKLESQLQTTQKGHDDTGRHLQTIRAFVSPDGEESQDGVATQE
ncbi:MAG: hypothetical protein J2P37_11640 [Ktedonobacteraceae bacterium]|nr:hypothetical protein [Ktedonobacteraceae bacterium]